MKLLILFFASANFVSSQCYRPVWGVPKELRATCRVQPNEAGTDQQVTGVVNFSQRIGQQISIEMHLEGFKALSPAANESEYLHGIHVHATGNLTGGCDSAGGHYNPKNTTHGGPDDAVRHVADFGNFAQTPDGKVDKTFTDRLASLYGPFSIVGRAFVVHSGKDDLGKGEDANSQLNGNSGKRLACCVIGHA